MKDTFKYGPFTINSIENTDTSDGFICFDIKYGINTIGAMSLPTGLTRKEIVQSVLFKDVINSFIRKYKIQQTHTHSLVFVNTGDVIASFSSIYFSLDAVATTLSYADSPYILRSGSGMHDIVITLNEYAAIFAKYSLQMQPEHAWIRKLLPTNVLTTTASEWCPPSEWVIRHIVGEDSFTGVTNTVASEMVGISPQNFRKYTASDTAKNKQKMSYATWHLLLAKLRI